MTTANIDDLVARLQAHQASLGDGRDVLQTPRAQEEFYNKKVLIARTLSGLRDARDEREKALPKLALAEEQRAKVLDAQSKIEQLIAEQPDWRTIADSRSRDREWARQQDLFASRRALINGCEYFSGIPAVPNALKKILGAVIESDGREVPYWYGTLADVEAQVSRWTTRRDQAQSALDAHLQQAEQLLAAATVTS